MKSIVNTAMALTECEAPDMAAAIGQGVKAGADTAENAAGSFKKKLQDCVAGIVPLLQISGGGNTQTGEGIQKDTGSSEISGICCIREGTEMSMNPTGTAQTTAGLFTINEKEVPLAAGDTSKDMNGTNVQTAGETPVPDARTQNTTAGETPALTQDEILKAVGAYISAAGAGTDGSDVQPQAASAAQLEPGLKDVRKSAPAQQTQTCAMQAAAPQTEVEALPETPADGSPQVLTERTVSVGPGRPDVQVKIADTPKIPEEGEAAEDPGMKGVAPADPEKREAPPVDAAGKIPASGMQTHVGHAPAADNAVTADAGPAEGTQPRQAENAPYTKENVLRIVDKVSAQAKDGRYDFDVELKPDFLGKVRIRLTMEDGSVRMRITAEDSTVRGMLSGQTSSLESALKEKGITLASVDVTYESQSPMNGNGQPYERNNGDSWQGSTYYAQTETNGLEPAAEAYGKYIGNSSVEFLA